MMQWQRLTPRSFADALAALSEWRWWWGSSVHPSKKIVIGSSSTTRESGGRSSRLVRIRRPF